MGRLNSIKGVERYLSEWEGKAVMTFRGTREALVSAGVCNARPFPTDHDDPRPKDRRGRQHGRFKTVDPQGREIVIRKYGSVFFVERGPTESEREELSRQEREETRRESAGMAPFEPSDLATMIERFTSTALESDAVKTWRLCEQDRSRIMGLKLALVEAIRNARVIRGHGATVHYLRLVKG